MSKVRNATDGPRYVPFLDREVGAGEEAEVPDAQPDGSPLVWPPPVWEYVRDDRSGTVSITLDSPDPRFTPGGSGDESGAM